MMADAPTQLQHVRNVAETSMTLVKDAIKKAVAQFDDSEIT